MKKIKILELCSGYGTATFALKMENISHELVGYSDINPYANQCFQQNHGGNELDDMTTIDIEKLPDFDLLTCGFPCTDVSIAGKQDLSKGRTVIAYYLKDYLRIKQPKYFMFENVKGILSKKFKPFLDELLQQWAESGYNVHYKVLNTKHLGIPQNRDRVWFVGIRTDIDDSYFKFPENEELKIFLKDVLQEDVDEKYYLSEKAIERILVRSNSGKLDVDIAKTITACNNYKGGRQANIIQVGTLVGGTWDKRFDICKRIYGANGISPCIPTSQGGGITPKIFDPFIAASRGRNPMNPSDRAKGCPTVQRLEPRYDGTSNCISTVQKDNYLVKYPRIRKLTPIECFRLQGFLNDEINLEGLSDTQRYKLAGNGQSVNVVRKIFRSLFNDER